MPRKMTSFTKRRRRRSIPGHESWSNRHPQSNWRAKHEQFISAIRAAKAVDNGEEYVAPPAAVDPNLVKVWCIAVFFVSRPNSVLGVDVLLTRKQLIDIYRAAPRSRSVSNQSVKRRGELHVSHLLLNVVCVTSFRWTV